MELVPRQVLVLVMLTAVIVRAEALFIVLPMLGDLPVNATTFLDGYDLLAWNLANGNGYRMFEDTSPTMIRTPGFVVVLAALFAVFGKSLLVVQVMNFAFSVLTALLVFDVSRRVLSSELVGMLAATIVLLHPSTIVADSRGGPESMLMLFVALCLWLCVLAEKEARTRYFAWLGLAFGAMILIKSSVALILPGVAAWATWKHRGSNDRHRIVVGFILACLVASLCMTPWIARNFLISGEFVPTMTVGPVAAFQGQHVVRNILSGKDHWLLLEEAADEQVEIAHEMKLRSKGYFFLQFYSVADELSYSSELARRVRKGYADSPSLVAKAVAYNLIAFWVQGRTPRATVVNTLIALPLLLLVAIGARYARQQGHEISLLLVFAVCFIVPHLLIISIARYYMPLLPVLSVLAAVPVACALRRGSDR
jgi:4-amino-4-deoxy-L-arabinose transferase-like glycosyltransferase